jgi:two-component system chemotaxis response regulator CheB
MQSSFAKTLQKCTSMPVVLARDGMAVEGGHVYVNPGGIHMSVTPVTFAIRLLDTPEENFVKPALDPLYRGLAAAFGSRVLASVLTGMGKDGFLGCVEVHRAGGKVVVQDPATAVVPSMPNAVIESGVPHQVLDLAGIATAIDRFSAAKAA